MTVWMRRTRSVSATILARSSSIAAIAAATASSLFSASSFALLISYECVFENLTSYIDIALVPFLFRSHEPERLSLRPVLDGSSEDSVKRFPTEEWLSRISKR